ncbi:MAG: antibiotic biosynthesis monooxygenase [Acidobacteria bacterium]|nr:antibiotic biosynthesis monooxygenase [Acidobacteriota bacterium]
MDEKIDVIAHIHAGEGNEGVVREALESFVEPTRKEEGCLRYDLFQDVSDPLKFTFIEEWASPAALERHSQSAHIAAGRAKMNGKLAGPSWVQVAKRIL